MIFLTWTLEIFEKINVKRCFINNVSSVIIIDRECLYKFYVICTNKKYSLTRDLIHSLDDN